MAETANYYVNFGHEYGIVHDFVNALADLGYRPSSAGGVATFPAEAMPVLRKRSIGADGAVRDHGTDGPCVWMRGYLYPVTISAPRGLAVRRACDS
jgi:hypothetical protein